VPEEGVEPSRPEGHGILSDHRRCAPSATIGEQQQQLPAQLCFSAGRPGGRRPDGFRWLSMVPAKFPHSGKRTTSRLAYRRRCVRLHDRRGRKQCSDAGRRGETDSAGSSTLGPCMTSLIRFLGRVEREASAVLGGRLVLRARHRTIFDRAPDARRVQLRNDEMRSNLPLTDRYTPTAAVACDPMNTLTCGLRRRIERPSPQWPSFIRRFSSLSFAKFCEAYRDYFALGRCPPVVVRRIAPQTPTAVHVSASGTETP
jgi:hypothetical protein